MSLVEADVAVPAEIAQLRRRSQRLRAHPAKRLNSVQRATRDRVIRRCENGDYLTEEVPCLCGGAEAVPLADFDRYGLPAPSLLCVRCGTVRTTPRLADDSLARFYDLDYRPLYAGSSTATDDFFADQVRHGLGVWSFTSPHGPFHRVADIGCGAGGILVPFRESGATCVGADLGSEYLERGRAEGLDLRQGSYGAVRNAGPLDLVILSHVLEHTPDPIGFLGGLREVVATRTGMVYVEVPGLRDIGRYGDPLAYFQNAHLFSFDLGTLVRLFESAGYQFVSGDEYVHALFVASSSPRPFEGDRAAVSANLEAIAVAERKRWLNQMIRATNRFCPGWAARLLSRQHGRARRLAGRLLLAAGRPRADVGRRI